MKKMKIRRSGSWLLFIPSSAKQLLDLDFELVRGCKGSNFFQDFAEKLRQHAGVFLAVCGVRFSLSESRHRAVDWRNAFKSMEGRFSFSKTAACTVPTLGGTVQPPVLKGKSLHLRFRNNSLLSLCRLWCEAFAPQTAEK